MNPYPDFRPWDEIRDERFRRVRATVLLFALTVLLVIGLGWMGYFANDVIATTSEAAYQARTLGADAIPTLGYAQ